ncbi:hypothetical protein DFJ77DRAFT_550146 [Powellomyces hirtus]|nr:hypothetical protein DFJ77DRAFT_550146 [Powellomyces hirtus]
MGPDAVKSPYFKDSPVTPPRRVQRRPHAGAEDPAEKRPALKHKSSVRSNYFPSPPRSPQQSDAPHDWYTITSAGDLYMNSIVSKEPHTPRYRPLVSPFGLLQEQRQLYANPWALLVATIFLNKTSAKVAKPVLYKYLSKHPTPEIGAAGKYQEKSAAITAGYIFIVHIFKINTIADESELVTLLQTLGLQNRRAKRLIHFSCAFLSNSNFTTPSELPGIGKYGDDSWALFCGRDPRGDVKWKEGEPSVEDKELQKYVLWRREAAAGLPGQPQKMILDQRS